MTGRHRALLTRGFFADGVVFQLLTPDYGGAVATQANELGRPHQH